MVEDLMVFLLVLFLLVLFLFCVFVVGIFLFCVNVECKLFLSSVNINNKFSNKWIMIGFFRLGCEKLCLDRDLILWWNFEFVLVMNYKFMKILGVLFYWGVRFDLIILVLFLCLLC